jgi:hypothetical protein
MLTSGAHPSMHPRETIYRLAHGQRDFRACHALVPAQALTLGWPTIVADRRGEILGFLATRPSKKAVEAGPLVIAPAALRPAIIMMRLIEAYEVVLKQAGVQFWFFKVDFTNPIWDQMVKKCGHEAYHQDGSGTIYRRAIA